MSISEIQKKKFLENIYRLMYSTGVSANDKVVSQPDENEIKKEDLQRNEYKNPYELNIKM